MFAAELPETTTGAKKQLRRWVRWVPLTGLSTGTGTPVLGIMELTTELSAKRIEVCSYIVTETKTAWNGRAFRLQKGVDQAGSDAEAASYEVFIGIGDRNRVCPCKGHTRWGDCKHAAALAALIDGGKL